MRIRRLLMLILVMITTAAAFPAAAAADYEGQSSFEYKKYEKPEQYMQALDKSMHRVYTALGPSIDDESNSLSISA